MLPIDKDGKPWSDGNANLMLKDIRRGVVSDMVERDEARNAGGSTLTDDGKRWVVDVSKAHLRHTGQEIVDLTHSRWAQFCSKKQDQAKLTDGMKASERDELIASAIEAGVVAERSLENPTLVEVPPPNDAAPASDSLGPDDQAETVE